MIKTNVIYNEDCLDTMARIKEPIIDLTITSPPYDNLRDYKGYSFDFEPIAKELYRVTKPGGVVVWVVSDGTENGGETLTSFTQALFFVNKFGFTLHDTMIFEKNTSYFPSGEKSVRYTQIFEYMFIFSKGKPKTINLIADKKNEWAGTTTWKGSGKRQINGTFIQSGLANQPIKKYGVRNNIWKYIVSGGFGQDKEDNSYSHPATFPEKLAEDHILSWSNEGDLIYDAFMGSGTTAKMAILNSRNWIGSEISDEYCELIKKRISKIEKGVKITKEIENTAKKFFDF